MYLNEGDKTFTKVRYGQWVETADVSAGAAWLDINRDGNVDIAVTNWGGNNENNALYINESNNNNWLAIQLRGVKSNKFGAGAKVSIQYTVNGKVKWQYQWMFTNTGYSSQNPYELHFGLEKAQQVDLLQIT
jgi:enediyne biosynthesis protein E4